MVLEQPGLTAEGLVNLRDLGGLPTAGGATTRHGRLLRSESPHSLSEAGLRSLLEHGVGTVLDLRTDSERERLPSPFAEVSTVDTLHTPLFDDSIEFPRHLATASQVYLWWLRDLSAAVGAALAAIADAQQTPILVHCHAGKDRTGVVVALVLRLAGVAVDAIADDYALSGVQLADMLARDRVSAVERGMDEVRAERLFTVRREAMEETLAGVDEEFGSVDAFLRRAGLSEARIERLAGLMLADSWP